MTLIPATTHSKKSLADPVSEFFLSQHYPQALSDLINEYVMKRPNCFGGSQFRTLLGVDVGHPVLPYNEFVSWWQDDDAVDRANKVEAPRKNCQTHFDPCFRPEFVRKLSTGEDQAYNLETLNEHAANPLSGGHSMTFNPNSAAFRQHARTPAGPGCWLVCRIGVEARNKSYEEGCAYIDRLNQEFGATYQLENGLLDLATVAAVGRVFKGERRFGDDKGIEGCFTYARSRDRIQVSHADPLQLAPPQVNSYPSAIGGLASSSVLELNISQHNRHSTGVAAVRKFEVLGS